MRALLLALVLASGAAALAGPARACDDDEKVGDLGFRRVHADGYVMSNNGRRTWRFRDEPRIAEIAGDGPAAGRLEDGDVLVAIDGVLITTREGGLRFGRVEPGQPVVLTVRRDGESRRVRIVPGEICRDEALKLGSSSSSSTRPLIRMTPIPMPMPDPAMEPLPAMEPDLAGAPLLPSVPNTPNAPRAPRAPRALADARLRPKGWLGVGLSCSGCGISADAPPGERVWEFRDWPEISYVDPQSPAARAGLKRGDVLTHVDGVSLLTEDGGRRFGAVRPGQAVKLTYRRGSDRQSTRVVAMSRPDADLELARVLSRVRDQVRVLEDKARSEADVRKSAAEIQRLTRVNANIWTNQQQRLRYSGAVGSSDVEVRGTGTVTVSKDEETGELIITTSDATIRVKPEGKDGKVARKP